MLKKGDSGVVVKMMYLVLTNAIEEGASFYVDFGFLPYLLVPLSPLANIIQKP